jgi:hypothetical protein
LDQIDLTSEIQMDLYCVWKELPLHFQSPCAMMQGFHVRTLSQYIEKRLPPFIVWDGEKDDHEFITPYGTAFTLYMHAETKSSMVEDAEEDTRHFDFLVYHEIKTLTNVVMGISDRATISDLRQFASSLHSIALWMEGKLDESRLFELPLIELL